MSGDDRAKLEVAVFVLDLLVAHVTALQSSGVSDWLEDLSTALIAARDEAHSRLNG